MHWESLEKYTVFISDAEGNRNLENIKITGESLQLPMMIALLSALTEIEISNTLAFSGNLNNDCSLQWINGQIPKITAAKREFPQISKVILPITNSRNDLNDIAVYYNSLEKVLEDCVPNIWEKIKAFEVECLLHIKSEDKIYTNDKGTEIKARKIFFCHNGNIEPNIVNYITDFSSINADPRQDILILDNFKILWLNAYVALQLKNYFKVVAIFDPKLEGSLIIHSQHNSLKVGTLLKEKQHKTP